MLSNSIDVAKHVTNLKFVHYHFSMPPCAYVKMATPRFFIAIKLVAFPLGVWLH